MRTHLIVVFVLKEEKVIKKVSEEKSLFKKNIMKDYDLLSKDGVIGFYNRCEIIEIVGFNKDVPFNIYTLVTFENSIMTNESEERLTNNLNVFRGHKKIKWGIFRKILSVDNCRLFF